MKEYLNDIYININGWLAKAGSENSKVTIKTKNIKTNPYCDIVSWWKSVNDIYAISYTKIDKWVTKLNSLYQHQGESCIAYFTIFEVKYTELRDLRRDLQMSK